MENNRAIIEWDKIILTNELTQYLGVSDLIELSLARSCLRNKLNPLIFKSICLNGEKLSDYLDDSKTSDKLKYDVKEIKSHCYRRYWGDKRLVLKNVQHDPIIKSLESSLLSIKQYVKCFKLYRLEELGYFAFSLSYIFDNLEKLDIYQSCVPLIRLVKLGENLKNLKQLLLRGIDLVVGYKMELSIDMLSLPDSLKHLTMSNNEEHIYSYITSDEGMIYSKSDCFEMIPFIFKMPCLDRFCIDNGNGESQLLRFLKSNPQLKSLELEAGYVNQDLLNYIAYGSSNLTELSIKKYIFHMNNLTIPTFKFITDLKLGQIHLSHSLGANICLNCPNLINLTIALTNGDIIKQFNIMLENIARSFRNLKKFELIVNGIYKRSFKFSCLTTIQTLIIRNYDKWAINLQANHFPPQFRYPRDICIPSGKVAVLNK